MKQTDYLTLFFIIILYIITAMSVRLTLINYVQNFWLVWLIGLVAGAVVTYALYKRVILFVKDIFR